MVGSFVSGWKCCVRRFTCSAAIAAVIVGVAQPAKACEFAEVRAAIDSAIDKDAKAFKKQFDEGSDPFTILETLVAAEVAKKIDACRFQAGEHLTKRGFPPAH